MKLSPRPDEILLASGENLKLVTPSGTSMDVNEVQYENTSCSMSVTLWGILTNDSDLQFSNAQARSLVTPSGITIDVRDVQSENTLRSMVVTLLEILMDRKDVQPENA